MRERPSQQQQQTPGASGIIHHRQKSQAAIRSTTPDSSVRSHAGGGALREQPSGIDQAKKGAPPVPEPLAAASTDHARIPERAVPHLPGLRQQLVPLETGT